MTTKYEERQALLADALESGDYKQGNGYLRTDADRYCCLGVACDIYRRKVRKGRWLLAGDRGTFKFWVGQDHSEFALPEPVRKWYGFTDGNGSYLNGRGRETTLVDQNDGSGPLNPRGRRRQSFKEIAKIIRRSPKELFS